MKMTRVLGLAAIGAVLVLAAPAQQAQALSLANPATVTAIQEGSKASTTEVGGIGITIITGIIATGKSERHQFNGPAIAGSFFICCT